MKCPNCGQPMGATVNESGRPVYVCLSCGLTILI